MLLQLNCINVKYNDYFIFTNVKDATYELEFFGSKKTPFALKPAHRRTAQSNVRFSIAFAFSVRGGESGGREQPGRTFVIDELVDGSEAADDSPGKGFFLRIDCALVAFQAGR